MCKNNVDGTDIEVLGTFQSEPGFRLFLQFRSSGVAETKTLDVFLPWETTGAVPNSNVTVVLPVRWKDDLATTSLSHIPLIQMPYCKRCLASSSMMSSLAKFDEEIHGRDATKETLRSGQSI